MKDIKDTNKNGDVDGDNDMKSPLIKRLARGTLPILYKEGVFQTDREGNTIILGNTKNIPANVYPIARVALMRYLEEVILMMGQDSNINEIVESSWNTKTPLHTQSMEFQRDVMVNNTPKLEVGNSTEIEYHDRME